MAANQRFVWKAPCSALPARRAARWAILVICAAGIIGCHTPPPNLKPPEGPDVLNIPPHVARYDNLEWPKEAMVEHVPRKKDDSKGAGMAGANSNMGGFPTGSGRPGGM